MSRVIKFRVWNHKANRMYFDVDVMHGGHAVKAGHYLIYGEQDALMQFTGLLDANGKGIYEGDILQIEDATAKVVFWERPPVFGLDYSHNEDEWCEDWNITDDSERMIIIGNIYENPELVRQ